MIRKKRHKWVQAEQQLRAAAATDDEGLQETSELEKRKKRGREGDWGGEWAAAINHKPQQQTAELRESPYVCTPLNPKP
jgi:hypothetical protein